MDRLHEKLAFADYTYVQNDNPDDPCTEKLYQLLMISSNSLRNFGYGI